MTPLGMLSSEDQLSIESRLKDFLKKSESQWAALVEKGGNLFAQCGETLGLDMSVISALSAGAFSATHELAKRLGEQEFIALYHEGKDKSIFMNALDFDCLLIAVFDEKTTIGLVRFYARNARTEINQDLHTAHVRNSSAPPLHLDVDLSGSNPLFS